MENVIEMAYVGHNHFSTKDKTKVYYIVQVLYNTEDISRNTNKASLINIFVSDQEYQELCNIAIGSPLKIEVLPNLETGKISYKIVK